MKKLFLMPIWVVQLFTQTKSFENNPVIGNPVLNRAGLHVVRLVLSHVIMRFRMLLLSRAIDPEHKQSYYKNGYILIRNFLDEDQFTALRSEVSNAQGEVRECTQGDTLTHRMLLEPDALESLPVCKSVTDHDYLRKLLKFASGKNQQPVSYIQTIKNHFVSGPPDPQKNLHSDTFHPTMKSWYFLDDVDDKNGPFTYVPGSHKLSVARLKWEYYKSIRISEGDDKYSRNGSLRATRADLQAMNLSDPNGLQVPANTLVIANTHGFHCRGEATHRSTRTELWTISRNNPFNPIPGIDHPWLNSLQYKALNAWRRHCDSKAEERGSVASWHIVEAKNTLGHE